MGRFTKQAEERFNKIRNRPDVPEWTGWVSGLVVIILIGWVFFDLARGDSEPAAGPPVGPGITVPVTTPDPGTPGTDTTDTTIPSSDTTGPSSTPPASEEVTLPHVNGGTVNVPTAAYDVAVTGTVAQFTGDWSTVPLATGATPASPVTPYPNPVVSGEAVKAEGASTVTFELTVDPDGRDGPQPPRKVTSVAVNEDGSWRFQPNG